MQAPYTLQQIEKSFLVIGNDFSRVGDYTSSLNNDLSALNYEGEVIFDLLLSNGNTSSRFYKAHFDGRKIVSNSYKRVENIGASIELAAKIYFLANTKLLFNSALTSNEAESFAANLAKF